MPFVSSFSRRSRNSSSNHDNDMASASDYHRYSSDHAAENDVQNSAANGALNTINNVNNVTAQSAHVPLHADVVQCAVEPINNNNNATGQKVEQTHQKNVDEDENNTNEKADDDSSAAWWNLLSNKGSFDTNSIAVSAPIKKDPAAAQYIQKEKMLRKKAFSRAVLGGSIRFDHTFSSESPTASPYHNADESSSWGVGLPSKQQDEEMPIEWTPQDSSYGAAVSAFGWLPKRIRKLAESVFVVVAIAILLYAVVKIGAEINHAHHSSSSGGDLYDLGDDDHYIAHNYNNGGDNAGDERFRFI